mmetsp:Transcript_24140/g.27961  ORF Transcript_24140/g.27961 Transcript_24140/m.27961 type:complete len:289 (-) Transcript_24140:2697-3563(-)
MTDVRYILLIAHPDDESMFFLPTLHYLVKQKNNNSSASSHAKCDILCLSNGNYEGLGTIRTQELKHAASVISPEIQVTVLNDPHLQDGPDETWSKFHVGFALLNFLEGDAFCLDSSGNKQDVVILTFDEFGVSGHTNHIFTYFGLMHFKEIFTKIQENSTSSSSNSHHDLQHDSYKSFEKLAKAINLQVRVLKTVHNPIVKYFPFFELLYLLIFNFFRMINRGQNLVHWQYVMFRPVLVFQAMKSHTSQFVWYRRLFVIFSRYSYINDMNVAKYDGTYIEKKSEKKSS